MSTLRTVRYQPRFEQEMQALHPETDRITEAWRAVEWALARNPEQAGVQSTANPNIWVLKTKGAPFGAVGISVYYSFDEDVVTLESVEKRSQ